MFKGGGWGREGKREMEVRKEDTFGRIDRPCPVFVPVPVLKLRVYPGLRTYLLSVQHTSTKSSVLFPSNGDWSQ